MQNAPGCTGQTQQVVYKWVEQHMRIRSPGQGRGGTGQHQCEAGQTQVGPETTVASSIASRFPPRLLLYGFSRGFNDLHNKADCCKGASGGHKMVPVPLRTHMMPFFGVDPKRGSKIWEGALNDQKYISRKCALGFLITISVFISVVVRDVMPKHLAPWGGWTPSVNDFCSNVLR